MLWLEAVEYTTYGGCSSWLALQVDFWWSFLFLFSRQISCDYLAVATNWGMKSHCASTSQKEVQKKSIGFGKLQDIVLT